jgi:hypothetical protein
MSWKAGLNPTTAVWHSVVDYAAERTAELTNICTAVESTEAQIRQAQAGILELQRLTSLPQAIAAETQIRSAQGARKEY